MARAPFSGKILAPNFAEQVCPGAAADFPGPQCSKSRGGPRNNPGPDGLMETPNHLGAVLFLKIEFLPSLQV